jgi:cytoskeletal protein CcmA (bactofilin family)
MRKHPLVMIGVPGVLAVVCLAGGLSPAVRAASASGGWMGRTRTVSASQTIEGDYFAAGPLVTISGTVNGDVYAFGGQVLIDGRVNGDVLVGAGRVSIAGSVSQDVRVAGGQVTVSGEIGRNATIAGGDLELTRTAAIRGSLVAAGGNIDLAAPVGNSVRVAAATLIISNRIGRDVHAAVGTLKITSRAEIQGDVRYMSRQEASVDTGARIRGPLSRLAPPERPRLAPRSIAAFLVGGTVFLAAVSFVSTLVLGLLSVRFLPRYHGSVTAIVRERPWASLGVGFVAAVVTPVACGLLFASIVGAPIGLILAASWAILLYWGRIFVIARIGEAVFRLFRAAPGPGRAFLVGLVIYYVLALIPLIGWLAVALAVLLGLGAELIGRKEFYATARRQQLL